mgnify:CR=1 FL=1
MLLFVFCVLAAVLSVNFVDASHHLRRCLYPSKCEKSFNLIVAGLFQDKLIPPGDVLDVGAHDGGWSCMYACLDPERQIHAMDPSPKLIRKMRCPGHDNFHPYNAAVSNKTGFMNFVDGRIGSGFVDSISNHEVKHEGDVPIETLDRLFLEVWKSVPGFLHIDVEGFELQALQGARQIITQHKPVFSIEIHVVESKDFTLEIVKYVEELGYYLYMVNEVCGMRVDCRNFICFPFQASHLEPGPIRPMLDLAHRTGTLVKVTQTDIFDVFEKVKPSLLGWFDARVFSLGN